MFPKNNIKAAGGTQRTFIKCLSRMINCMAI